MKAHPARNWLIALVLCVVAVIACARWVDRPVACFVEAHIRHTQYWLWLDRALSPLVLIALAALLFPLACGLRAAPGNPLPRWTSIPARCSWAAIWALAFDTVLKRLCGRGTVDPGYIRMHAYGFHFLHGGTAWDAFPSTTAAIAAAITAVLWHLAPQWRRIPFVLAAAVLVALIAGNFHWLSDVIAGTFIGATLGWLTAKLPIAGAQ